MYKSEEYGQAAHYVPTGIKSRLITLLVLILCAVVLTGCVGQGGEAPGAVNQPPADLTDASDTASESASSQDAEDWNYPENENVEITDEVVTEDNIAEFVTLGEFMGIEFNPAPVIPVTESEIDWWIDQNLGQTVDTVEITDRPVMLGDIVNIDFEGFRDDVAFPGGQAYGFDLTIGSGQFIPGFEEQIIGHSIGDEFDIHLAFPDDYFEPSLAGAEVVFRINLHAITVQVPVELTDELIQEHLGLDSIEEYRAMLREEMEADRQAAADNQVRFQVWTEVVSRATVHKLPEAEVSNRIERSLVDFEIYAMFQGVELEELINEATGVSLEEFIDQEIRPSVEHSVTQDLILRAVAMQAGITISDEAFEEAVAQFVIDFGFDDVEHFLEVNGEDEVRTVLLAEEVLEFLVEHAVPR